MDSWCQSKIQKNSKMPKFFYPPNFIFCSWTRPHGDHFGQRGIFFSFLEVPENGQKRSKPGHGCNSRPDWPTGTKCCTHNKVPQETGEWPFISFDLLSIRQNCDISRPDKPIQTKLSTHNTVPLGTRAGLFTLLQLMSIRQDSDIFKWTSSARNSSYLTLPDCRRLSLDAWWWLKFVFSSNSCV